MKKLLVFAFALILIVFGGSIVNYIEKTQEFPLAKNSSFFYGCFMIVFSFIIIIFFNEEKEDS
ncbi:hypothetical protein L5F64_00260 [Aliarcobacter butzleri]|uniref:hypothetical protein n=1 Tax=Aliarcobacter butzleri TaxID=28197 RepID=UPI001EDB9A6F|nr:hypothetical protein [Aliarcobacter butzleri]MCG3711540.1 hypothetical protein [Aliarcobacter butzleri]MCG3713992.1 hypothetical protein [Aliarcobacter butzleri]